MATAQHDQEWISQLVTNALEREIIKDNLELGIPEEITRQQLAESRQLSNYYDCLLIAGYTEEQIDVAWEGKTPQEILALPNTIDGVVPQKVSAI